MKLERQKQAHYDSGPNLMPVVNIAMVVLIVFMIGITIARPEHFLQTNIPMASTGVSAVEQTDIIPKTRVDIYVSSVDDHWRAVVGSHQVSDILALEGTLRTIRDATDGEIQVVISPTRTTRYQHLIDVYQAAMGVEFENVAFAPARDGR